MTIASPTQESFLLSSLQKGGSVYLCAHSVMLNSLQPHGLQPARFLCLWGFSRQKYWSGLPCPPPGDLLTQGSNPRLLYCRQILYHFSHPESPCISIIEAKKPIHTLHLISKPWSVFPSNSLIFCRILPFSSDMCSTSPSLRNFFNTLYCFLANFLEKIKLYTCFFHSYNIIKATFSDNK